MGYHTKIKIAEIAKKKKKKMKSYCKGGKGISTRIKKYLGSNQPLGHTGLFEKIFKT